MSALTAGVYAVDKSAAIGNRRRVRERNLYLLGVLGGWPGALLAQRLFRHKSAKARFQALSWTIVVFNCAALAWWLSLP